MKCLTLCLLLFAGIHPFHLSVTEIFHNREAKSLEISLKLFVDDMDEGIEKAGYGKMYLGTQKEHQNANLFLYKYLLENLNMTIDGKAVKVGFVGKEYEPGNVMWCYLEVKGVKKFSKLKLQNHILTEVFGDQQNIVHVKKGGQTQSLRLRKGYDSGEVEFK